MVLSLRTEKNKAREKSAWSSVLEHSLCKTTEWWIEHSISHSLWISTLNLIFKAFLAKTYISIWHDYLSGEPASFDKSFTFSAKITGEVLGDPNLSGTKHCSLEVDYLASWICHSKEQQIHLPDSIMERRHHHFPLI